MAAKGSKDLYAACGHISRTQPEYVVNEEIAKQIGLNYRTLPSFEKGLYEHLYINHYSLERNELLKCRWNNYKQHIEDRVFAPFTFPEARDLHFYNGDIRFIPAFTPHRFPEYRMKLKSGPGVDFRGQMPIPQELHMKRGRIVKEDAKVKKAKGRKRSVSK